MREKKELEGKNDVFTYIPTGRKNPWSTGGPLFSLTFRREKPTTSPIVSAGTNVPPQLPSCLTRHHLVQMIL